MFQNIKFDPSKKILRSIFRFDGGNVQNDGYISIRRIVDGGPDIRMLEQAPIPPKDKIRILLEWCKEAVDNNNIKDAILCSKEAYERSRNIDDIQLKELSEKIYTIIRLSMSSS